MRKEIKLDDIKSAINAIKNGELEFVKVKADTWSVHTKQYLKNENGEIRKGKPFSIVDNVFTQHGTNEIINLFGNAQIFSFPKPTTFIKNIINIGLVGKEDLVLDFFSGSAASADAILQLNAEDDGKRKFIQVQIQEETDVKSEAFKAGYKNICNSRPGFAYNQDSFIPRTSLTTNHTDNGFEKLLMMNKFREIKLITNYELRSFVKGFFGENNYLKFRKFIQDNLSQLIKD